MRIIHGISAVLSSLVFIVSMQSCDKDIMSHLKGVESYLNEAPDSALHALGSFSPAQLKTRRARARYALLISIALDKNGADVTADSIIAPAVNYYRRHGSADDRLRTFYYRGLVSYNAGDSDAAMNWFIMEEESESKATDNAAKGRLHRMKQTVYSELFLWQEALAEEKKALSCFEAAKEAKPTYNSLINISNLYLIMELPDSAITYLSRCGRHLSDIPDRQRSLYYSNLLEYDYLKACPADIVERHLQNYRECSADTAPSFWLNVGIACNYLKHYSKALEALELFRKNNDISGNQVYFSVLSQSLYGAGKFKDAYSAYSEYVRISDRRDLDIFRSEAKFAEERHRAELARQHIRYERIIYVLIFLLLAISMAISSVLLLRKLNHTKKEKLQMQRMLDDARQEMQELKAIIAEGKTVDKCVLDILNERFLLLNEYIKEAMSGRKVSADERLRSYMKDKEHFLDSIRISFRFAHPDFISALENFGLNEIEQTMCCLTRIGIRTKEIAAYFDYSQGTVCNKMSEIRKKMNLDGNRCELGTILRNMCADSGR